MSNSVSQQKCCGGAANSDAWDHPLHVHILRFLGGHSCKLCFAEFLSQMLEPSVILGCPRFQPIVARAHKTSDHEGASRGARVGSPLPPVAGAIVVEPMHLKKRHPESRASPQARRFHEPANFLSLPVLTKHLFGRIKGIHVIRECTQFSKRSSNFQQSCNTYGICT